MNNRGISSIELLVSFVIISFVAIGMFNAVFDLLDKIEYHQEQISITVLKGNITNSIQKDLKQRKLYGYTACGINCFDITFQDLTTRRLKVDNSKNTIQYGGIAEKLPKGFDFTGDMVFNIATISAPTDKNDTILRLFISISSSTSNINGNINIVHQYDSRNMKNIPNQIIANAPALAAGMTPIKWDGSAWVNTNQNDIGWYNYNAINKMWANAKTADGSMWVWIPRYIYKIASGWHTANAGTIEVQFTKGTNDNWNSASIGNIDTGETADASNNKWTNHPAFTFGDTEPMELTGIWVAKFEASSVESIANDYRGDWGCPTAGDNVSTKTIKILPNVQSWRCISIGNAFTASRNMETNPVYGWETSGNNIDTHLMKNSEWGAVVYLSKSSYGQGANEIWKNNSQSYTTGCAGNAVSDVRYYGCQNAYNTTNGLKASTTGNIYGIYDMSGGAWERVSAYVDNGDSNLAGQGSSIINADTKYKDVYTKNTPDDRANNYLLTISKKGDAVWETSSNAIATGLGWFGDLTTMSNTNSPWINRGVGWVDDSYAGVFALYCNNGGTINGDGFRPTLLVGPGL